jgi:hypothetical protein
MRFFIPILFALQAIIPSETLLDALAEKRIEQQLTASKLYRAGESEYHRTSVTFYKGKTCFTTAFLKSFRHYEVEFEINSGNVQRYKVECFVQHPKFLTDYNGSNYSLSILILDRTVTELSGLSISDELPEPRIFGEDQYPLIYVGYSTISARDQKFSTLNGSKKILQVPIKEYTTQEDKFGLFLEPYRGEGHSTTIPYHFLTNTGMWGGGVFDKDEKLVSIIGFSGFRITEDTKVSIDENLYKPLYGIYSALVNVVIPYIPCTTITPYNIDLVIPGIEPQSVPLKPLKRWIEETRAQHDDTYIANSI